MSLACFECMRNGTFNTLIIFDKDGKFDPQIPVSHYSNFYTDCASIGDFKRVSSSRFAIVQEKTHQDSWNTGTDGDKLQETNYKLIDEADLAKKLPRIYGALIKKA
jgi:hypothetical protein